MFVLWLSLKAWPHFFFFLLLYNLFHSVLVDENVGAWNVCIPVCLLSDLLSWSCKKVAELIFTPHLSIWCSFLTLWAQDFFWLCYIFQPWVPSSPVKSQYALQYNKIKQNPKNFVSVFCAWSWADCHVYPGSASLCESNWGLKIAKSNKKNFISF